MEKGFEKCDSSQVAWAGFPCSLADAASQTALSGWLGEKTGESIHPRDGPQKTLPTPGTCGADGGKLLPIHATTAAARVQRELILVLAGTVVCRVEEELSSRLQFYKRSAGRKIRDSQNHCCFALSSRNMPKRKSWGKVKGPMDDIEYGWYIAMLPCLWAILKDM